MALWVAKGRLLLLVDVYLDVSVSLDELSKANAAASVPWLASWHVAAGLTLLAVIFVPYLLMAAFMYPVHPLVSFETQEIVAFENLEDYIDDNTFGLVALPLRVLYTAIGAIPKFVLCDLILIFRFIFTDLGDNPQWGHCKLMMTKSVCPSTASLEKMLTPTSSPPSPHPFHHTPNPMTDDRLRQLFESFFEAPPQASLQFALAIMSAAIYGAAEDVQEKYFSIAISLLSMCSNFLGILDGAKKSEEPIAVYVEEVLRVGVGHIPHIAAIRDGRLEEADYSNVSEKLLLEGGGQGLKRIFDAIGDGEFQLKRILFSREGVVHNLGELIEPANTSAGKDAGERTRSRDRVGTKITVTLGSHATEAEGLFLATLLEARAGLDTVVLVRKGDDPKEEEEDGTKGSLESVTGHEKEDRVRSAGSRLVSLKVRKDINQGNIGVAAAQIVSAFLRRKRKLGSGLRAPWSELDMSGIGFSENEVDAFVKKVLELREEPKGEAATPRRSLIRRLQIRRSTVKMTPFPNVGELFGFDSDGKVVPVGRLEHRKVVKIGRHVMAASKFAHGNFGGQTFDVWLERRNRQMRERLERERQERERQEREAKEAKEREEARAAVRKAEQVQKGGIFCLAIVGVIVLVAILVTRASQ